MNGGSLTKPSYVKTSAPSGLSTQVIMGSNVKGIHKINSSSYQNDVLSKSLSIDYSIGQNSETSNGERIFQVAPQAPLKI